jgi:hypothetical protein
MTAATDNCPRVPTIVRPSGQLGDRLDKLAQPPGPSPLFGSKPQRTQLTACRNRAGHLSMQVAMRLPPGIDRSGAVHETAAKCACREVWSRKMGKNH